MQFSPKIFRYSLHGDIIQLLLKCSAQSIVVWMFYFFIQFNRNFQYLQHCADGFDALGNFRFHVMSLCWWWCMKLLVSLFPCFPINSNDRIILFCSLTWLIVYSVWIGILWVLMNLMHVPLLFCFGWGWVDHYLLPLFCAVLSVTLYFQSNCDYFWGWVIRICIAITHPSYYHVIIFGCLYEFSSVAQL